MSQGVLLRERRRFKKLSSAALSRRPLSPRKTPSALRHNDLRREPFRAMLCRTSKRIHILGSVRNIVRGVFGVLGRLLRFARPMLVPKAVFAAKLLAAESQLAACVDAIDRKKAPKPRFKLSFRLLRVALSRLLSEWRKLAHVMRPATVGAGTRQAITP